MQIKKVVRGTQKKKKKGNQEDKLNIIVEEVPFSCSLCDFSSLVHIHYVAFYKYFK